MKLDNGTNLYAVLITKSYHKVTVSHSGTVKENIKLLVVSSLYLKPPTEVGFDAHLISDSELFRRLTGRYPNHEGEYKVKESARYLSC